MSLTKEQTQTTVKQYGKNEQDTGNTVVQIALYTTRINEITGHLKSNPKDFACLRGLFKLVGKRRRLLNYYKNHATPDEYAGLLKQLGLRK